MTKKHDKFPRGGKEEEMSEHWLTKMMKEDKTKKTKLNPFSSFLTSSDFCHLLITFANSLDPGQSRYGSKPFDTLIVYLKDCFEKVNFEKSQQTTRKKLLEDST